MRERLLRVLLCIVGLSVVGCQPAVPGNGDRRVETRQVGNFTALKATGTFSVYVFCDASSPAVATGMQVRIVADANLLPYISTQVVDYRLELATTRAIESVRPIAITLHVTRCSSIAMSGDSTLIMTGIHSRELKIALSGRDVMTLDGMTSWLDLRSSGRCRVYARDLKARNADVSLSGKSSARVDVTGRLEASVSGGSSLLYAGHPRSVEPLVSGEGRVHAI